MRVRAAAAVLVVTVALAGAAGCSSSGDNSSSSDTSSAEKSAVAPDTTEATSTTTKLGPPPPPGTIPFVDLGADAATDGVSPIGSGCTPGTATTLPDGRWFGRLMSIDSAASTIELDLECLFTGDAANAAATADGASEVPVPNDVYVRNESKATRTLHVIPDVPVGVLTLEQIGGVQFLPTQTGLDAATTLVGHPVWVEITNGWVVAIQEQYFP